jgi:ectoine hydroxylase-related dioxygenase (phytanoyl-CoA dioxygenase family)
MVVSFDALAKDCELSADAEQQLSEMGFTVGLGPVPPHGVTALAHAYDAAMASAASSDVAVGSTTTRVHDFVNRGPAFDALYVFPPILKACCHVIGQPFKLSSMLARTLRPHSSAQGLHVDFKRDLVGFPMVGFILMIDEFRPENGATRFVPRSHTWPTVPDDLHDRMADHEGQVLACGPPGTMIIYNGSVWHGHTANSSDKSRRSIQGAYIRRKAQSGFDLPSRMTPETLARICPIAKYLIAVQKCASAIHQGMANCPHRVRGG